MRGIRRIINRLQNKKGVFYTIIAFTIVSVVFFYVLINLPPPNEQKMSMYTSRITTANGIVKELNENYLERTLRASGYSTLYTLNQIAIRHLTFIPDLQTEFRNAFLFGTANITGGMGTDDKWDNLTRDLAFSTYMGMNITLDQGFGD